MTLNRFYTAFVVLASLSFMTLENDVHAKSCEWVKKDGKPLVWKPTTKDGTFGFCFGYVRCVGDEGEKLNTKSVSCLPNRDGSCPATATICSERQSFDWLEPAFGDE